MKFFLVFGNSMYLCPEKTILRGFRLHIVILSIIERETMRTVRLDNMRYSFTL